ncbi:hypothetical protein [Brevundimonas sp.]|uniref:hypothetical protein n=1 Tax=Brevundimonas sp. TaxID=1871086 RepID=UPI002D4F11CB|nr:hypothetical protein [Brevundimonas sp.]HYC68826.1 hypothetical protein [Brevundimonas sp.]
MSDELSVRDPAHQGPLNRAADDGVVVVQDPPNEPMRMTPDEADISGIRMLDAADRARKGGDKEAQNDD